MPIKLMAQIILPEDGESFEPFVMCDGQGDWDLVYEGLRPVSRIGSLAIGAMGLRSLMVAVTPPKDPSLLQFMVDTLGIRGE